MADVSLETMKIVIAVQPLKERIMLIYEHFQAFLRCGAIVRAQNGIVSGQNATVS